MDELGAVCEQKSLNNKRFLQDLVAFILV